MPACRSTFAQPGPILLLFGQHLTRITALPTQAVTAFGEDTFLTLDRTPIPLPSSLAGLLTDLATMPPPSIWAANSSRGWLFPGGRPAQHLSATLLGRRLATHPIPNRPARATALAALAQDLPPAVLGPRCSASTRHRSLMATASRHRLDRMPRSP